MLLQLSRDQVLGQRQRPSRKRDEVVQKGYLYNESPRSFISSWAVVGSDFSVAQLELYEATDTGADTLCNRLDEHSYEYDPDRKFQNKGCWWGKGEAFTEKVGDGYFFATSVKSVTYYSVTADVKYSTNCSATLENAGLDCLPGSEVWTVGNGPGRCECSKTESLHAAAVDNLTFSFTHRYQTSDERLPEGNLPKTIIRRKVYEAGETVHAYVWQMLEWAGVDLDKRINEEPN
eukprot:gene2743-3522_t